MREEKKAEKRQELVGVCLDCFVEKGLTVATTKDLCKAAKLQNGGIYYYFSTKEEIVLACAEEAISRIEKAAFAIVFEDISDIKSMMDHLGELADKMSPTMRFLVSVCVSREYGEKVKPSLVRLAARYPYYTGRIAEILGCTDEEVAPFVHLSILAINNYMIFAERALFDPQIEAVKKELSRLAGIVGFHESEDGYMVNFPDTENTQTLIKDYKARLRDLENNIWQHYYPDVL